jgi:hypothetical protein
MARFKLHNQKHTPKKRRFYFMSNIEIVRLWIFRLDFTFQHCLGMCSIKN